MASAFASSSLVSSVSTSGGHFGFAGWGGGAAFLAAFNANGAFALLTFLGAGLAFLRGLGADLRAGVLTLAFDLRGFAFFAAFLAVFRGLLLALVLGALSLEALAAFGFLALAAFGFLALAAMDFLAALVFFFAGFFRGVILLSNRCGF
jgi:hypothetical protein